jgi:hypothetical protein
MVNVVRTERQRFARVALDQLVSSLQNTEYLTDIYNARSRFIVRILRRTKGASGRGGGASGSEGGGGNHQDPKREDRSLQEVGRIIHTHLRKLRILPSIPYSQTFCRSDPFHDIRHDLIFYHVKKSMFCVGRVQVRHTESS